MHLIDQKGQDSHLLCYKKWFSLELYIHEIILVYYSFHKNIKQHKYFILDRRNKLQL